MQTQWLLNPPGRRILIVARDRGEPPKGAARIGHEVAAWSLDGWLDDGSRPALAEMCSEVWLDEVGPETPLHELREGVRRALHGKALVAYDYPVAYTVGGGESPIPEPPPPSDRPEPRLEPWKLVSLAYVPNIAPDKEAPKPQIKWTLKDPSVRITQGKLELFRTRTPADPSPIWTMTLAAGDLADGDHALDWDGAIGGHGELPDGFVSIEFSPYKLKLTVSDGGEKQEKEASFEVVVVDFEIALGDKALLGEQKDIDLHDKLGGALPAAGASAKLMLVSNVFKTSSGEMSAASGASFTEYQSLWGAGPRVPIEAKVWIKDSKGQKVLAPKAWGRRKILWDWECVKLAETAHAEAKTFCNTARDFHKDATKPKGENCHKDRGGKRSTDGTPVVFGQDSGGSFPYAVSAAKTRVHAAFSEPAKSGPKDGLSGAIFRPARTAGDGFKVTAYFDAKKDLDVEGTPSAAFKKETGTFEVWREVHLTKYVKKKGAIAAFTVATMQGYYDKAFVKMEDKTGGASTMAKADYDTAFAAAIQAQPALCKDHAVDASVSQYDAGNCAVTFRAWAAFVNHVRDAKKAALLAADPTLVDPALTTQAQAAMVAELTAAGLTTSARYADKCDDWALAVSRAACSVFMGANDGVNIMQFEESHNLTAQATSMTNGYAPSFSNSSRSKVAFLQYAPAARYASGGNSNTMEQTISHEVGHHMFLCHAPLPAGNLPGGAQAAAHDQADLHCLMGYDYTAERKFCGLCLLRMRGWDHRLLDKDGTKNKAP